jgi:hypothetical protein
MKRGKGRGQGQSTLGENGGKDVCITSTLNGQEEPAKITPKKDIVVVERGDTYM